MEIHRTHFTERSGKQLPNTIDVGPTKENSTEENQKQHGEDQLKKKEAALGEIFGVRSGPLQRTGNGDESKLKPYVTSGTKWIGNRDYLKYMDSRLDLLKPIDVKDADVASLLEKKTPNNKDIKCRSDSPLSYVSSSSEEDSYPDKKSSNATVIPPVDPNVIIELEEQARIASKSLSKVMKYLSKNLQETTEVTNQAVTAYDKTVQHTQEEVENNIRAMYGLMTKCEELDHKMKPVTELASQVAFIKETLTFLEELCKNTT